MSTMELFAISAAFAQDGSISLESPSDVSLMGLFLQAGLVVKLVMVPLAQIHNLIKREQVML